MSFPKVFIKSRTNLNYFLYNFFSILTTRKYVFTIQSEHNTNLLIPYLKKTYK